MNPDEYKKLLEEAQLAQLNGNLEDASRLYAEYYANRPLLSRYSPLQFANAKPPRLSIIVPCHNSEKYIEQCIDSILLQDFSDFELIIVDDGSQDGSLDIILKKALSDKRIIVVRNDIPSGSAGLPRNQALNIARGDLVGFVDSDDWVEPSYFKLLVEAIEGNNADVAISSGFINHDGDDISERIYPQSWRIKAPSPELACTHMSSMIWDKIYKKDLLIANKILLGSYPAAVDVPFILKVYFYSKSSVVVDTVGYNYRRETENSVTVKFRKGSSCEFELKAYQEIFDWSNDNSIPESYISFMKIKRLASFIYTCKLVKINFFSSYFSKCRKILIQSHSQSFTSILSLPGQHHLKKLYQVFLDGDMRGFIESQRPADQIYFLKNSNNGDYNLARTIYLSPKFGSSATRNLVFFPDWSFSNPYQKLFYENLQDTIPNKDINVIGLGIEEVCQPNLLQLLDNGDILHVHWIHPFISSDEDLNNFCEMIDLLKTTKNILIIWTIHNTVSHECSDPEIELKRRKYFAQYCDRFIVHSDHASNEIQKLYSITSDCIHIVPHGKYHVDHDKLYWRTTKSLQKRTRMRLSILGELRSYKNVEWAAEFICKLNNQLAPDKSIELRIAGKSIDKSQSDFLFDLANKNDCISLKLARLTDSELFNEFCDADFIFAPYSRMLTSGICLNSISHGRPFIAPNFLSLLELHRDTGNSFLYDNSDQLSDALLKYNDYFHRGFLHILFDPKKIVADSANLEWPYIFEQLAGNPFASAC